MELFDWRDIDGNTPLHLAVKHGNIEIVKLLLTTDIYINTMDNEGRTAFDISVLYDHKEISKLLLDNGGFSTDRKNQIIEYLIKQGAKSNE